ncbi:MAG: ATP-binding protein [Dethiobacteria bacterium]
MSVIHFFVKEEQPLIISVASGKGGTGKTTISTNLALALKDKHPVRLIDGDVEEPNAHIFMKPQFTHVEPVNIPVPRVNEERCTYCGKCASVCAYNALAVIKNNVMIFDQMCHGCGGCTLLCPEKAITETDHYIGVVETGSSMGTIAFVQGRLDPGVAISPPLIDAVKKKIVPSKINIIDAPPGTSCPAVTAVRGSDYGILVTEPTPFGLNDLQLAAQMLHKLGIPAGVIINRCDTGDREVENFCHSEQIPVLLKIPWSRRLASLYAKGEPTINHIASWKKIFIELFNTISRQTGGVRQ